jgi:hypothetical protein
MFPLCFPATSDTISSKTLGFGVCSDLRAVSEALTSQRLRFSYPLGLEGCEVTS